MKRIKRIIILAVLFAAGYMLMTRVLGRLGSGSDDRDINPAGNASITAIHDDIRKLVLIQTYMLEGHFQSQVNHASDGSTLGIVTQIDQLIRTDMTTLLESTSDRHATLQGYISQADQLSYTATAHLQELEQERQAIAARRTQCQQSKAVADHSFYRGLQDNNTSLTQQGLANSKEYGACDVQLRIEYNALGAIIAKLHKKNDLLTQKSRLLAANQDLILTNFAYFRDQQLTLETLAQLRTQLERIQRANALLQ